MVVSLAKACLCTAGLSAITAPGCMSLVLPLTPGEGLQLLSCLQHLHPSILMATLGRDP